VARAESTAEAVWEGDLLEGSGTASGESGVLGELPVTWAARVERSRGKTSPEELLAASHASCYAMALSGALARRRTPPERLHVRATASFEQVGEAFRVTMMELTVRGRVPGLDEDGFNEAVEQANEGCPISNALRGNVEITVQPELEQG
jgi:osmotically inducible protein OsmC